MIKYYNIFVSMSKGIKLRKEENLKSINEALYCMIVRKVIYLLNTKLNISFVFYSISYYIYNLHILHLDTIKYILHHLKGMFELRITYHQRNSIVILAFIDAN